MYWRDSRWDDLPAWLHMEHAWYEHALVEREQKNHECDLAWLAHAEFVKRQKRFESVFVDFHNIEHLIATYCENEAGRWCGDILDWHVMDCGTVVWSEQPRET